MVFIKVQLFDHSIGSESSYVFARVSINWPRALECSDSISSQVRVSQLDLRKSTRSSYIKWGCTHTRLYIQKILWQHQRWHWIYKQKTRTELNLTIHNIMYKFHCSLRLHSGANNFRVSIHCNISNMPWQTQHTLDMTLLAEHDNWLMSCWRSPHRWIHRSRHGSVKWAPKYGVMREVNNSRIHHILLIKKMEQWSKFCENIYRHKFSD